MGRLLGKQKVTDQGLIGDDRGSMGRKGVSNSQLLKKKITEVMRRGMARSRSGQIGKMGSHNLVLGKRMETGLEEIKEKPRRSNLGSRGPRRDNMRIE